MKTLILILLLALSLQVNATQQIREEFDVDMAIFKIKELPFNSFSGFDDFYKNLREGRCSASWRGYKGYWALRGEKLMLTSLVTDACSKSPIPVDASELFKNKNFYLFCYFPYL